MCPGEIVLDDFDVLLEGLIVLDVAFSQLDSCEQPFVQVLVDALLIANKGFPDLTSDFDGHTAFYRFFKGL